MLQDCLDESNIVGAWQSVPLRMDFHILRRALYLEERSAQLVMFCSQQIPLNKYSAYRDHTVLCCCSETVSKGGKNSASPYYCIGQQGNISWHGMLDSRQLNSNSDHACKSLSTFPKKLVNSRRDSITILQSFILFLLTSL